MTRWQFALRENKRGEGEEVYIEGEAWGCGSLEASGESDTKPELNALEFFVARGPLSSVLILEDIIDSTSYC